MAREHTCDGCGHYTWNHTKPHVAGGCLTVVKGACCPCLKEYEDGMTDEDVMKVSASRFSEGAEAI